MYLLTLWGSSRVETCTARSSEYKLLRYGSKAIHYRYTCIHDNFFYFILYKSSFLFSMWTTVTVSHRTFLKHQYGNVYCMGSCPHSAHTQLHANPNDQIQDILTHISKSSCNYFQWIDGWIRPSRSKNLLDCALSQRERWENWFPCMGKISVKVNIEGIIIHSLHTRIQNQYLKFGEIVLIRIILNDGNLKAGNLITKKIDQRKCLKWTFEMTYQGRWCLIK